MNTSSATSASECSSKMRQKKPFDRLNRGPVRDRKIRRLTRGGAAAGGVALIALLPEASVAQQLDAARFAIEIRNQRVGTESYRVWRARGSINAQGTVDVRPPGGTPDEFETQLQTDGSFRPMRYQLQRAGSSVAEGVWTGDRMRLHVVSEAGERWKDFLFREPVAVLDAGVAHHYLLLVHHLNDPAVGTRMTVVVPSAGEQMTITVTGKESDQVRIADRAVAATRYEFDLGGSQRRVWVDADGHLLKVEDPSRQRVATRLFEG